MLNIWLSYNMKHTFYLYRNHNIIERIVIFAKKSYSSFLDFYFYFPRKNYFPLVRWIVYTNQAMYTQSIHAYSTIYKSFSIYTWLSLCDTLDKKRWGNYYPHNNKRLLDKTCYFSTSFKTQLASFWTWIDIDITPSSMGDLLVGG